MICLEICSMLLLLTILYLFINVVWKNFIYNAEKAQQRKQSTKQVNKKMKLISYI